MITYRRFQDGDSIAALTEMLHRAYGALARRGMRFLASHQDDAVTLDRVQCGETIVAVHEARIVGTITLRKPQVCDDNDWYKRADVASFEQLAVDPEYQGRGIGRTLMDQVEALARAWGVKEIALDTSERAPELIEMYTRRGYRVVGEVSRDLANYRSIVLSKPVND